METIVYKNIVDKSSWGEGPWNAEPDKMQWQDPATSLPCLIVRGPLGALCGYVGVPSSHPLHGKSYHDFDVSVHGGLTFANGCQDVADEARGVCHKVGAYEEDNVWWFGFDCGHCFDMMPGFDSRYHRINSGIYRTFGYVLTEVAALADQLAALGAP